MLSYGRNITGNAPLERISPEALIDLIRNGNDGLKETIQRLRHVQALDVKQYQRMKKDLPYFCCGIFTPPIRRTEHFVRTEYFVLDIDHMEEKQLDPGSVRDRLRGDPSIMAIFVSPGGNGLKLLFRLKEACFDPVKFSLFYKMFAREFSVRHGLEQALDKCTCDVTRACFLSWDPEIHFVANPLPVDMHSIIDFEHAGQVLEAENILREEMKARQEPEFPSAEEVPTGGPDRGILNAIRSRLNPNAVVRKERPVEVPAELDHLEVMIRDRAAECGFLVSEVRNIQYGKQITFRADHLCGELNIFYGKKGYSVVKSTKSCMDPELGELAWKMVQELLY